MSCFKWIALALATMASCSHADPQLSRDDIDFVREAARQARALGSSSEDEGVPASLRDRLGAADMGAIADIAAVSSNPEARVSSQDMDGFEQLAEAADRPMAQWLQALDGSPFVAPGTKGLAANESLAPTNQLDDQARLLVFISLGMPEGTLKNYFKQAANRDDVVFVVRGWKPPHFTALIKKLHSLMPSPEQQANIIVDPTLFREYKVGHVPMFLAQDHEGAWRRLYGEISIDGALEEIGNGRYWQQIGPTYAIAEPDIIEEIQARAEAYDWEGAIQGAKDRLADYRPGVDLPGAEKDEVYYVDPSVTINRDVINPQDGMLIAAAGSRINPLDTVSLERSYVIFDPESHGQTDMVKAWLRDHPTAMVIATRLPPIKEGTQPIGELLQAEVYALDAQIVERFGLKASMSIVEQEGNLLRITVKRGQL